VERVTVALPDAPYDVLVGAGALADAGTLLGGRRRVAVVSQPGIADFHAPALVAALQKADVTTDLFLIGEGEDAKSLTTVDDLCSRFAAWGLLRDDAVVALGGGVVGDTAGFAASVYHRGVSVVQAPTTLLAQVDAAIGGKTAVNLVSGKNLIGSFHQPFAVLADPAILDTLPEREYRAGLYEILKAGIIRERELFTYLAEHSDDVLARRPEAIDHIIAESVRMKADVVSSDEREGDQRRILNFGHTFGHALEAETEYRRFLHGEAVAWGMRAAVYLGESTGYVSAEDSVEILQMIAAYGPIPSLAGISADRLLARLVHDKKTVQGNVHFVLPVRIGEVTVVSGVDEKMVLDAIRLALV